MEIDVRLNKLEYNAFGSVTTSAQNILEIFPLMTESAKDNMKTFIIHNNSGTDIYFGSDNTATTLNGAIIKTLTPREFPMKSIADSPYFISSAPSDIRIEVWG